ncbi:MAG: OmpH family outer membrane protein [Chitinophagaceae bacterium]|nr:MAG: OmpH family outer membrane protein [Chitinophagaceae bacterium]
MNKIKFIVVALVALFSVSAAQAQKIGYISLDNVVALMPDVSSGKLDSVIERYQTDSLAPRYAYNVAEYQRKDSLYRDSVRTPAAQRAIIGKELEQLVYEIQNWQQLSQQAVQAKQQTLLEPIYRRVVAALNAVAKENNYAYVLNKETLLVAPQGDDLLPLVTKKLGIKLPNNPAGAPATRPGAKQ